MGELQQYVALKRKNKKWYKLQIVGQVIIWKLFVLYGIIRINDIGFYEKI